MGQDLNRAWQSASQELSPEVLFVQQQMEKYGVDMFLDIHGDEEIPYVFTAGCEGNPGYTPRIEALEKHFRSHLSHLTRDFQTTHGYTRDLPGQANMTLALQRGGGKVRLPVPDPGNAFQGQRRRTQPANWLVRRIVRNSWARTY